MPLEPLEPLAPLVHLVPLEPLVPLVPLFGLDRTFSFLYTSCLGVILCCTLVGGHHDSKQGLRIRWGLGCVLDAGWIRL